MRKTFLLLLMLASTMLCFSFNNAQALETKVDWALIIQGTDYVIEYGQPKQTLFPLYACYYMFHVLTTDYGLPRDHIKFLSLHALDYVLNGEVPQGTFDDFSDPEAVANGFAWLKSKSTSSDSVLIFVVTHGGGYLSSEQSIVGGLVDMNGDEGNETWDGSKWFGVDECLHLGSWGGGPEWNFWDDDFKGNLRMANKLCESKK